jgi:hypothetical protein
MRKQFVHIIFSIFIHLFGINSTTNTQWLIKQGNTFTIKYGTNFFMKNNENKN